MLNEVEKEKIEKLNISKRNLIDKNNKIYFFIEESEIPALAIYEIYNHVRVLRQYGYDAILLSIKEGYKIPDFIDQDMKAFPHVCGENNNFSIKPEDFLIIPEIFTNVMEQVKNLPCTRIILMQSFENALKGIIPGVSWADFNVQNVITTSPKLTELTKTYFGNLDIKEYVIGIPDYFKASKLPKEPYISFYTRNNNDMSKVIKMFYMKYPQYTFLSFEDLRGLSREKFAEKISQSFACLWIDRIASFGTTAIEAMKTKTLTIGLIPEVEPEYISEDVENGLWTNDINLIPDLINQALNMFIQSAIPDELYEGMAKTADKYTDKISKESILNAYSYYFDKRIKEFDRVLKAFEERETKELNIDVKG